MEHGFRCWARQPLLQVRRSLVPGAAPTFAPDRRPVWSWTPGTLVSPSSGTVWKLGLRGVVIQGHRVGGQVSFHSLAGFL